MKEKRYYCDWALGKADKREIYLALAVLIISLVVVTDISSVIYYTIFMHNHGEDLEAYSESAYEYLDEIADNVISKDGINLSAIPKDVVDYEITYNGDEIVFKYYLDNNKEREYATSANMTITLSKDFEILSRKPNFSSKEDYVKEHKSSLSIVIPIVGAMTWALIVVVCVIVSLIAIPISAIHKKKDEAKKLS